MKTELTPEAKSIMEKIAASKLYATLDVQQKRYETEFVNFAIKCFSDPLLLQAMGLSSNEWISVKDNLPEDTDIVLWAKFPICEPPVVASMCDVDFDYNVFTHYLRMPNEFFILPTPPTDKP